MLSLLESRDRLDLNDASRYELLIEDRPDTIESLDVLSTLERLLDLTEEFRLAFLMSVMEVGA